MVFSILFLRIWKDVYLTFFREKEFFILFTLILFTFFFLLILCILYVYIVPLSQLFSSRKRHFRLYLSFQYGKSLLLFQKFSLRHFGKSGMLTKILWLITLLSIWNPFIICNNSVNSVRIWKLRQINYRFVFAYVILNLNN